MAQQSPNQHDEVERELHARLLAGDLLARSQLAEQFTHRLLPPLRRTGRTQDASLIETAAHTAVLDLMEHPERYDPERSSLVTFLTIAARRDLLNLLQQERRHTRWQAPLEFVELSPLRGNTTVDGPMDKADEMITSERDFDALLTQLRPHFPAADWPVACLKLDGERKTKPYARALQIEHLSVQEQRQQVKRAKDRVVKRLQRLAPRIINHE